MIPHASPPTHVCITAVLGYLILFIGKLHAYKYRSKYELQCLCMYMYIYFLYYNENVSKCKNLILKLTGDDSSGEITPEDRLQHNLSSTANRRNVE